MAWISRFYRFDLKACPLIFSLLSLLAILVFPLMTAAPVHADWGPDTRLTNDPDLSLDPRVAVAGNSVHVVWFDRRSHVPNVYYKRSIDGGATWGSDTMLSTGAGTSVFPAIAVSGNNVHVVWFDSRDSTVDIYYKRSTDGGTTWGSDTRLSTGLATSQYPAIAVAGNNVHVVWQDIRDLNWEIYYKLSTDGGTNWGADTRLTNDPASSLQPQVAAWGNNVHVVWFDYRANISVPDAYYKRSTDGGASWGADTRLSTGTLGSISPCVAVWENNVHVVWFDFRDGPPDLYYRRSTDGGTNWGTETRISTVGPIAQFPSIAVSANNVHVVWVNIDGASLQLLYERSADSGTTWAADTQLTNSALNPTFPNVAASGNSVHVVWWDVQDGNPEIYYKKFTPVPVITSINPNLGTQGQILDNVIISGANFTGATGVSFGDGITVNSFRVSSDARIILNITISPEAAPGFRNVSLTTPGASARLNNAFAVVHKSTPTSHSASMTVTPQGPVSLPSLSVKSASLSAGKVAPGTPVTVTANVANTGAVNGATRITLYVNGQEESTQGITVNAGSNSPVTFNVSRNEPGAYTVYVGGTNAGSFTVDEFAGPGVFAIVIGAWILLVFVTAIVIYRRRSQFR